MLPRSKRLSVSLFADVLANGKIVHSPFFMARILKTALIADGTRFSVAISKRIAKTAVERNKLRRRAYSVLRSFDEKIKKGFHIVLLAKSPLTKARLSDIEADLNNLFVKSSLIK